MGDKPKDTERKDKERTKNLAQINKLTKLQTLERNLTRARSDKTIDPPLYHLRFTSQAEAIKSQALAQSLLVDSRYPMKSTEIVKVPGKASGEYNYGYSLTGEQRAAVLKISRTKINILTEQLFPQEQALPTSTPTDSSSRPSSSSSSSGSLSSQQPLSKPVDTKLKTSFFGYTSSLFSSQEKDSKDIKDSKKSSFGDKEENELNEYRALERLLIFPSVDNNKKPPIYTITVKISDGVYEKFDSLQALLASTECPIDDNQGPRRLPDPNPQKNYWFSLNRKQLEVSLQKVKTKIEELNQHKLNVYKRHWRCLDGAIHTYESPNNSLHHLLTFTSESEASENLKALAGLLKGRFGGFQSLSFDLSQTKVQRINKNGEIVYGFTLTDDQHRILSETIVDERIKELRRELPPKPLPVSKSQPHHFKPLEKYLRVMLLLKVETDAAKLEEPVQKNALTAAYIDSIVSVLADIYDGREVTEELRERLHQLLTGENADNFEHTVKFHFGSRGSTITVLLGFIAELRSLMAGAKELKYETGTQKAKESAPLQAPIPTLSLLGNSSSSASSSSHLQSSSTPGTPSVPDSDDSPTPGTLL